MSRFVLAIAAMMFMAAPVLAQESTVRGVTVDGAPICHSHDLDADAKTLLNRWVELNRKMDAKTLTPEEFAEGQRIAMSGQCGLVRGGVPVVVTQLDGVDYLGRFPDGDFFVFKSDGFIRDTE